MAKNATGWLPSALTVNCAGLPAAFWGAAPSMPYETLIGAWSPAPVMVTVVACFCQSDWPSGARLAVAWAYGLEMLTQPVRTLSTLPAASVAK